LKRAELILSQIFLFIELTRTSSPQECSQRG